MTGTDRARERHPGTLLLVVAAVLLLALAAAQGYVSFRAQYAFIDAAKHARVPSMLEALGLDTGAVVFAVLGLAHARAGRAARIERALNIACALGSMTMNLLGADLTSPRSVAVYVLPALLYAAGSDRLIATAAVVAGVPEASVWRWAGRGFLYGLRLAVAFPSTARGLRLRLLQATPLPGADDPASAELAAVATAVLTAAPPAVSGSAAQARAWCLGYSTPWAADPGDVPMEALEPSPADSLSIGPQDAPEDGTGDTHGDSAADTSGDIRKDARKDTRNRVPRRPRARPRARSRRTVTEDDAEREFMSELAAGDVPGIREIKRRLHVGDTRASALRRHLESVTTRT